MRRLPGRATATALAAVLLAATPLLAACGSGQNANVRNERFGEGVYTDLGKIRLQNIQVHPLPGQETINGTAELTFSVFNDSQDRVQLTAINSDSGGQVQPGAPTASTSGGATATPSSTPSTTPSPSTATSSATPSPSASTTKPGKKPGKGTPSASGSARPSQSPSASAAATTATPSPAPVSPLPMPIPAGGALVVGPTGSTQLAIAGLDQPVPVGGQLVLTFQFQPGGSSGRITVPVTPYTGTTALSSPTSQPPTSYPAEPIDPSWYQKPYDDIKESVPPPPPGH